jgi:hypothetical protein
VAALATTARKGGYFEVQALPGRWSSEKSVVKTLMAPNLSETPAESKSGRSFQSLSSSVRTDSTVGGTVRPGTK